MDTRVSQAEAQIQELHTRLMQQAAEATTMGDMHSQLHRDNTALKQELQTLRQEV